MNFFFFLNEHFLVEENRYFINLCVHVYAFRAFISPAIREKITLADVKVDWPLFSLSASGDLLSGLT